MALGKCEFRGHRYDTLLKSVNKMSCFPHFCEIRIKNSVPEITTKLYRVTEFREKRCSDSRISHNGVKKHIRSRSPDLMCYLDEIPLKKP